MNIGGFSPCMFKQKEQHQSQRNRFDEVSMGTNSSLQLKTQAPGVGDGLDWDELDALADELYERMAEAVREHRAEPTNA